MSGGWKRYARKCHVKSDWLPIPITISFLTNT
jgi:mRNA-degrading endonuclease YafQ of YafQ-DinJ toxin-antitoxin module